MYSHRNYAVVYRPAFVPIREWRLVPYVDTSHADNVDYKTTFSYVTYWGPHRISVRAASLSKVAGGTGHSEVLGAVRGTHDATWTADILEALNLPLRAPILAFIDAEAARNIINRTGVTQTTKHLAVPLAILRQQAALGSVQFRHVHTKNNVSDIDTKSLQRDPFERLLRLMDSPPHLQPGCDLTVPIL
jgi:hypothetical protein